jgi:carbonic anhydrase
MQRRRWRPPRIGSSSRRGSVCDDIRDELIERIEPAHTAARQRALERMAIQQSLENIETFSSVRQAVEAGRLRLDGAWFSIATGELHWLDWDSGVFAPIDRRADLGGAGAAARAS